MAPVEPQTDQPPALRLMPGGGPDVGSLADVLEWFLDHDERTGRMRHPMIEELFQWKQADDLGRGEAVYPFENAEARFAIGSFQALAENPTEPDLNAWITDILNALSNARETKTELTDAYALDASAEASPLQRAEKLTTTIEKRLYLTSCWIEALCTSEARFLGWIYQQLYNKPFTPNVTPPPDA